MDAISVAKANHIWPLALLAGYMEGEDMFRSVCMEYCSVVFPPSNTLAVILPLILSQGKVRLEGVSLENWPRLLSGVLATVSSANSIPILTEMGKNLAAQQHLIPAQICFMVEIGAISDT